MQKYYKLLSQEMTSHNGTKWEINKPITILKPGIRMCTDQVLHCYNHPLLASFLNPIHARIKNPRLFLISVDEIVNNDGLKFASKSQTLLEEIPYIDISLEKRIEIGIKIAKTVCKDESWNEWADKWLNGTDRSRESAYDAAVDADAAYYYAAVYAGDYAANPAAAYYAANAAAANAAADADADAAVYYAAADAAAYAADADKTIFNEKLIEIVESVVNN
jgi:hypothetical protein